MEKKSLRQLKELKNSRPKTTGILPVIISHTSLSQLWLGKKKKAKAWYGYNSHQYCYMYTQNKHSGLLILMLSIIIQAIINIRRLEKCLYFLVEY